jgi:perosamine synthetase
VSKFVIPVTEPNIGKRDVFNLMKVLYSGNLVQGNEVSHLEKLLCQYFNVNYAVLVSSGTSALHLALLSLSIGPGDDVVTTPYSFIATANAIKLAGANVIFADTCKDSVNICPSSLASKITPQTKANCLLVAS